MKCIQELDKREGNKKKEKKGGRFESATKDQRQKRVWDDKEEIAVLKHAHIKYRRPWSGRGERKCPRNARGN